MNLEFDFENITTIEFGLGHGKGDDLQLFSVPVDEKVQFALREMVEKTWQKMGCGSEKPAQYEPSEKYASTEYLYLETDDPIATRLLNIHKSENLSINIDTIKDLNMLSFYFARLTDNQDRRLTALRRATQFKGVLKNKMLRLHDDSLELVEDEIFKLDNDFDLLIDLKYIHILRPNSLESVGDLKQAILDAVPENVKQVQKKIDFVDFEGVEQYATKHPRAARYLASILKQDLTGIDSSALRKLCKKTDVEIQEVGKKITVAEEDVLGFLEVLDRRRYEVGLIPNNPESYKATSRQKINN